MDNSIFIQYAPVIIVVFIFLIQQRLVVTPEMLEKKHREILNDVENRFTTKEASANFEQKLDDMQSKIDKITDINFFERKLKKMTKTDLVNVIAAETEIKKKDVEAVVNATLSAIANALKEGDKVQLIGFCTFEVKEMAARECRNPRTGETVMVPATKRPVFTAGKALKDAVNNINEI